MVSRRRYFEPGYVYHVLNRGAERQQLFFSDDHALPPSDWPEHTVKGGTRVHLSLAVYLACQNGGRRRFQSASRRHASHS